MLFQDKPFNVKNMQKTPPGRKIGNRYLFSSGRIVTDKSGSPLEYESGLEKDILSLLIFDNTVKSIKTQPFTINWHDGKKWKKYTPDILVEFIHPKDEKKKIKTVVFEVKPVAKLKEDWKNLKQKYKEARKWCQEREFIFKLITDEYINKIYTKNIYFLLQYDKPKQPCQIELLNTARIEILSILSKEPKTIIELLANFKNKYSLEDLLPLIWLMIRNSEIHTDLHEKLSNSTIIFLNKENSDYNFLQSEIRSRLK